MKLTVAKLVAAFKKTLLEKVLVFQDKAVNARRRNLLR